MVVYHLQQQTPMIHFQHDEPGACLRASEVKPKLDRFLLKQLGDGIKPEWKIGTTEALDYKMRSQVVPRVPGTPWPKPQPPHKLYFGNMGVKDSRERRKRYSIPMALT